MIKFYFQYDKDRHQAKVVLDGDPAHIEMYFVDVLVCEVPVVSELSDTPPRFIMRGECKSVLHIAGNIRLTNKR